MTSFSSNLRSSPISKWKNSNIMINSTCLKESLVLASWIRASLKSASSATAWRSRLILVTTATTSGSVLFSSQRTFQQSDTKILAHLGYFVINLRTYWHTFYRAKQCSSDKYQVCWRSSALLSHSHHHSNDNHQNSISINICYHSKLRNMLYLNISGCYGFKKILWRGPGVPK